MNQKIGRAITGVMVRLPLIFWSLFVLFPLFWMFLGAFKSNGEIFASPWALPRAMNFSNFTTAWTEYNIGNSFVNSLIVTVTGTLLCLMFSIPTAYAVERVRFKGSRVLFNVYLASMMVPMVLGWIPLFFLLVKLNMMDNLWALSLIYAVTEIPFTIFILASFMGTIPRELEEAAAVDGISQYTVLFRVITPLLTNGIVTVSVMNAVTFWNEYFMALIFLQTEERQTLGVAMDLMNKEAQYTNDWGALFAGLSIAIIPVIFIYAIFQRRMMKSMTEGAIK